MRLCRRLLNTNSAPWRGSSPRRALASACSPLKPLRMSQASSATNTLRLPEKLSMPFAVPATVLPPAQPVWHPAAAPAHPWQLQHQRQGLFAANTLCLLHHCLQPPHLVGCLVRGFHCWIPTPLPATLLHPARKGLIFYT